MPSMIWRRECGGKVLAVFWKPSKHIRKRNIDMPYLVAKNFYQHGCYAMPVEHGPELVELKHDLQAATSLEHLQLVTISRPAAYGEYAPYTIIKDREEFIRLVLQMKPCQASDEDVKKISEQLMEKNRTAYETLAK